VNVKSEAKRNNILIDSENENQKAIVNNKCTEYRNHMEMFLVAESS